MVSTTVSEKLKNIGIALEYASDGKFPQFAAAHAGETILLLADRNTKNTRKRSRFRRRGCV